MHTLKIFVPVRSESDRTTTYTKQFSVVRNAQAWIQRIDQQIDQDKGNRYPRWMTIDGGNKVSMDAIGLYSIDWK